MKRQQIEVKLRNRSWFQNSDEAIQQRLLALGEDCNGFLEHLANRPTNGGGVRMLRIKDLLIPDGRIFGIFINIEVQKLDADIVFAYQYFVWKQGAMSGTKGVVLIETEGKITHVVCLKGFSFAAGAETFDCPGGFSEDGSLGINENFIKEVQEELNLPEVKVTRVIDLGFNLVDRGMTPNCPAVLAAVISGDDASSINEGKYSNPDPFEMEAGPVIIPVEKLWGKDSFSMKNPDSFFGICCWKLTVLGILRQPTDLQVLA